MESPLFTPSSPSRKTFGGAGTGGVERQHGRKGKLRATFPGEPPLEASPAGSARGGGSTGRSSFGGEAEGFSVGAQQEEGYMSFAALNQGNEK